MSHASPDAAKREAARPTGVPFRVTPPVTLQCHPRGVNKGAMLWNAPRPKPREPAPGEPLWVIERDGKRIDCEIRNEREAGAELQVFVNRGFRSGRLYSSRAAALAAAESLRMRMSASAPKDGG